MPFTRLWGPALRRGLVLLAGAAFLLALAQPSPAQVSRTRCEVCGRFWDTSPCRMVFTLVIGRHQQKISICSPFCFCERLEKHPDIPPVDAKICYFPETKDRFAGMIPVDKATCLYGIAGNPELTAEPYVAAFRTREEAKQAQAKTGGELLAWGDVFKRCKKLAAANNEPPQEEDQHEGRRPH